MVLKTTFMYPRHELIKINIDSKEDKKKDTVCHTINKKFTLE